jgi:hypothetical protein
MTSDFGSDFGMDWGPAAVDHGRLIINGFSVDSRGGLQYWYRYADGTLGPEPPTQQQAQ